jgi:hypothetical protein
MLSFLLPLSFAFAAIPAAAAPASPAPDGVTVPMLDIGGRPMVDVTINGKGPYPFILDTGADFTGIDETLAAELNLPSGTPVGGEQTVSIADFGVGEFVVHDFKAGRMPSLVRTIAGERPPRGVLSAAAFPGRLVVFDYPGKRVTIAPGALPAADNRRVFEYAADEELPVIPVRVGGQEFRIHLDSGSPAGVTLPTRYVDQVPVEAPPVTVGQARTVAGTFPVQMATVKGAIEIGEYTLADKQVRFSDVRPGSKPAVGNLGAEVLRHFIVTFDSKNRRLKLERPLAVGRWPLAVGRRWPWAVGRRPSLAVGRWPSLAVGRLP